MTKAVLFDLGNTLVRYYTREEFPSVLRGAVSGVRDLLDDLGLLHVPPATMSERVKSETRDGTETRVKPLEGRLCRIFELADPSPELLDRLCRRFLEPIFALSVRFDDALPVLEALRARGLRLGIVSNTPWGSPAAPWREEVARHGLADRVDAVVFCRDTGWRKPAPPVFELALDRLGVSAGDCLFVGDDPRWDIVGPESLGMPAALIDRTGSTDGAMQSLHEVLDRLA
jgi:putative hydrolase of the HAD superfamily